MVRVDTLTLLQLEMDIRILFVRYLERTSECMLGVR